MIANKEIWQDCYQPVAVVTEEQLVVVLAGAAERAGLALDALPGVLPHTEQHVLCELQAGGVTWPDAS